MLTAAANSRMPDAMRSLLLNALGSKRSSWPHQVDPQQVLQIALDEGVLPLLYAQHCTSKGLMPWPQALCETLAVAAKNAVALDAWQQHELTLVLEALAKEGIHPLLMKGAALAYSHYSEPHLRPRCDTDLLLREEQIHHAQAVLSTMGYREPNAISGDLVTGQLMMTKADGNGVLHCCDIHWKISNALAFAELFSYGEAEQQALAIPTLCPHARGLGQIHALLLACVHRVAHHNNSERLIWLYDIHLLASTMSRKEIDQFVELALTKKVGAVCRQGLELAHSYFATSVSPDVMSGLSTQPVEPTCAYLEKDRRRVDRLISDLRSLPGWRQRIKLLREHAFPPRAYMLRRYQKCSPLYLPVLYAHRLVHALRQLSHPL